AAVVAGVLILAAAFYDQHFPLLMLTTVLLYIVVCLGLNLQFGYAGVVNFAGAAFFGIGCYTAAVLTGHTALPHLLVVLAGGVMAAAIGSLLLLPVLRTSGHYAALVTIAFSILFRVFIEVNDALGGPQGMKVQGMEIFGWTLNDGLQIGDIEISFYANYVLLALAMAAVAFMLVRRLERSWIGLSLDAVRLDETASAAFGIDVARWKITAFTLGNFLIGLAGAVYAMMTGFVAPNAFTFGDSLILVSIVILGGIGNPWGLTVAAAIVLVLPEKLQFIQEYRLLLYAGLVILILLFRPGGLMPRQVRNYLPGWKP
ncbi:MAG: branched-chain amino acid ABC transporter permease, partial [Burkholderiales bacterium]|nr:branched-chain amino acid ABC transporter permease [Burkholderiales bacterium]